MIILNLDYISNNNRIAFKHGYTDHLTLMYGYKEQIMTPKMEKMPLSFNKDILEKESYDNEFSVRHRNYIEITEALKIIRHIRVQRI